MGSAALFTQLMDGSCEHGREILSKIALELKHEVANQGVVVMQAGEYGSSMFLVGDGEVEIYRRATAPSEIRLAIGERPPREANSRVRLGRLGPRGFFGELAVMRSGGSFGGIDAAEATSKVRRKPGLQASISSHDRIARNPFWVPASTPMCAQPRPFPLYTACFVVRCPLIRCRCPQCAVRTRTAIARTGCSFHVLEKSALERLRGEYPVLHQVMLNIESGLDRPYFSKGAHTPSVSLPDVCGISASPALRMRRARAQASEPSLGGGGRSQRGGEWAAALR